MTEPAEKHLSDLTEGTRVRHAFAISAADMERFSATSGDRSLVHVDAEFARRCGFKGPVVYGGLITEQLSYLLGMILPGAYGVSTAWQLDFRKALYVDEQAVLEAEVVHRSEAARSIKVRFILTRDDETLVRGQVTSSLLAPA